MKGAGAIISLASLLALSPLVPTHLHAQGQNQYSQTLEQKLADGRLSEKEKNLYIRFYGIMTDALRKKGININAGYHPSIKVEDKYIFLHIKPEYLRSPRGGSGALRLLIYLGEEAWYEPIGIDNFILSFYSVNETKMSKKIYEVNVNYFADHITNMSTKEIMFEGDVLNKRMEKGLYTVLKKLKITKKNVNEVLFGKALLEDLLEYNRKQDIMEKGALLLHDHVCLTEIHYTGYGFIEPVAGNRKLLRAPKLIEIIIERGEESIKGFHIAANLRFYYRGKGIVRTYRTRERHISYKAPMNMKVFAKTLKIKIKDVDVDETEEEKEGED